MVERDDSAYFRMQEDAETGRALIEIIANSIGCEADPGIISKAIYNGTDCGAYVHFDEKGILVGTIVESSGAEYNERIELTDDDDELCARFWAALERCEDFADENFELELEDDDLE